MTAKWIGLGTSFEAGPPDPWLEGTSIISGDHTPEPLVSLRLSPAAFERAVAVASTRGRSVASYLVGVTLAAHRVARPRMSRAVSRLVAARILADHAQLGANRGDRPLAPFDQPGLVVATPDLARKTLAVARSRGLSVGEYLAAIFGSIGPDCPIPTPLNEVAGRIAAQIERDHAELAE